MPAIFHDLRYALRQLRRAPGFTLTVVLTLGIGIGLNTAIFAVVDCVVFRPLGYHDADRIVGLQTHFPEENRSIPRLGGGDYSDLSRQVNGLEAAAYYQSYSDGIELDGSALYLPIAMVSPGFPQVMGFQPVAGRLFQMPGSEALVSAAFAREHFGSTGAALGRNLRYGGALWAIAGVVPDGFSFPDKTAVWFEAKTDPDNSHRSAYNQQGVGKRRAEVSEAQLTAELAAFSRHLQLAFPEDHSKTIEAVSLQAQIVGNIRPTLRLLMGSAAVILLIVLANVTHLQLVRATRELRSAAIRNALGASRAVLAAQALLEAALLAVAGCGAALLLAVPALKLLVSLAPPDVPRLNDVHLNYQVLLVSAAASLLLMSLTALLPIFRFWNADPAIALRQDSSRGTESRGSLRLRNSLLVAEVALTLALSVASILLARQLIAQSRQDLGFAADNLIALDAHIVESSPPPKPDTSATPAAQASAKAALETLGQSRLARLDAALATVASVPGVDSVTAMLSAPMNPGSIDVRYAVRGRHIFAPGVEHLPNANINAVGSGFLRTLHAPLLRGRELNAGDRADTPPVLLISQSLAKEVFSGQNPLGQQIMCGFTEGSTWWTIVGVVGDMRDRSPGAAPYPTLYVPIAQHPDLAKDSEIVVRTRTDPAGMADTLRKQLKKNHPEIAIKTTTMQAAIADAEGTERFRTLLFACFAAVSILLAGVGLYGVTAYTVALRRFEFGLRIALGANRSQVLSLVLWSAAKTTALGIMLGVALSIAVSRILAGVVGVIPAFDAPAYLLASSAMLLLSLFATLLPARSAANADPATVLRSE